jgi:hypothetical protein
MRAHELSPEGAVDPLPPDVTSLPAREAAIALARSGAPLNSQELRAILQIAPSTFYYHAARGRYDTFKVKVAVGGARIYSGTLVARWLDGDAVYTPTFGRRRERS